MGTGGALGRSAGACYRESLRLLVSALTIGMPPPTILPQELVADYYKQRFRGAGRGGGRGRGRGRPKKKS